MPVSKIRKRYVLFEISTDREKAVTKGALEDALGLTNSKPSGPRGSPERIALLIYDPGTRRGIIRTPHTQLVQVRQRFSEANRINDQPFNIQVLSVSGTIKKLKSKLFARDSPIAPASSKDEASRV